MRLFDTHAHLSDEKLHNDLPEVLERARAAGVERVILPASDLADSYEIIKIVEAYPKQLSAAVGVHPHEASRFTEDTSAALEQLLEHAQVVALGEIGLDYHYDFSPRDVQKQVFRAQLELAHAASKPVILHDREAHGDFLEILQKAHQDGLLAPAAGVVHCYGGSWDFAKDLLKLGFYLGFDGPITYKNAKHAHEVILKMPLERLLIETDSPYLSPQPFRGRLNEPAHVVEVCKKVAELRGLSLEEAAELTFRNSLTLFDLT